MHLKEEALKKASQNQENLVAQLTTEKTKTQQQMQFIKRLQRKLLLISKVNYKSGVFPCNCVIKNISLWRSLYQLSMKVQCINGTNPRFLSGQLSLINLKAVSFVLFRKEICTRAWLTLTKVRLQWTSLPQHLHGYSNWRIF